MYLEGWGHKGQVILCSSLGGASTIHSPPSHLFSHYSEQPPASCKMKKVGGCSKQGEQENLTHPMLSRSFFFLSFFQPPGPPTLDRHLLSLLSTSAFPAWLLHGQLELHTHTLPVPLLVVCSPCKLGGACHREGMKRWSVSGGNSFWIRCGGGI